jgi:putative tryptophan/tyrosine transport system substrate-binding protein
VPGRVLIALLAALTSVVVPIGADAQQAGRIPRIGLVASSTPFVEAFKQGLHELGYVEGRNIVIEYRSAEGKDERLPGIVGSLSV